MQTNFTSSQLNDPKIAESESILRKCVHCGFCTATCPTFVLLGDELDSPRGRIYLIKDLLENERPVDEKFVKHIDRCLSCLSCMTTCPSGVNYMHLVDHARSHIESNYRRPLPERLLRYLLMSILPFPGRFKLAARLGSLFRWCAPILSLGGQNLRKYGAMLKLVPSVRKGKPEYESPGRHACSGTSTKGRVALLNGCVQPVLNPDINDATVRLLNRIGYDVILPQGEVCCGALVHHMGKEESALENARLNVDTWWREITGEGLEAVIVTASGCGTMIKDYGHMLRCDQVYSEKAEKISSIAKDITEFLSECEMGDAVEIQKKLTVAYHSACSMQHGQKITDIPKKLLSSAGFAVKDVPEGHLCCGSAGTYNITQPEIAVRLRDRKIENIRKTGAELVATGNIGCMTQLGGNLGIPIVHTVELLDWAYGGPVPKPIAGLV